MRPTIAELPYIEPPIMGWGDSSGKSVTEATDHSDIEVEIEVEDDEKQSATLPAIA